MTAEPGTAEPDQANRPNRIHNMTTYRKQTINHIKAYTLEKERILTDSSEVAGSRDGLPRPKAGAERTNYEYK